MIMTLIWTYLQEKSYAFVAYFDAGVDGTDEEDVGKDDEDADVKAEHKCCSTEERKTRSLGRITLINSS